MSDPVSTVRWVIEIEAWRHARPDCEEGAKLRRDLARRGDQITNALLAAMIDAFAPA